MCRWSALLAESMSCHSLKHCAVRSHVHTFVSHPHQSAGMSCAVGARQGVDPTIPGNFGNTSGNFDAIFVATPTALFSCAAMTPVSHKARTRKSGAKGSNY